jgi:hypothetical protein
LILAIEEKPNLNPQIPTSTPKKEQLLNFKLTEGMQSDFEGKTNPFAKLCLPKETLDYQSPQRTAPMPELAPTKTSNRRSKSELEE